MALRSHSTSERLTSTASLQVPGVALGTLVRDVPPVSFSTCNVGPFGLLKPGRPNVLLNVLASATIVGSLYASTIAIVWPEPVPSFHTARTKSNSPRKHTNASVPDQWVKRHLGGVLPYIAGRGEPDADTCPLDDECRSCGGRRIRRWRLHGSGGRGRLRGRGRCGLCGGQR